jgi:hypothetical protein
MINGEGFWAIVAAIRSMIASFAQGRAEQDPVADLTERVRHPIRWTLRHPVRAARRRHARGFRA